MSWISVILALPEIIRAFIALVSFGRSLEKGSNDAKVDKVSKEIDDAKTPEDFKNAASDLSKLNNG